MNVLTSWKESWLEVAALRTKNGRLLGAAIQKKIKETYQILFKHWWFVALAVGALIISSSYQTTQLLTARSVRWSLFATIIFLLMGFLSARSSVNKKNYRYFVSYLLYLIGYVIALLIVIVLASLYASLRASSVPSTGRIIESVLLLFPFNYHIINHLGFDKLTAFFLDSAGFAYSAYISLFMFFWLDTTGRIKDFLRSLYNAGKMMVINFPFIIFVYLLFAVVFQALHVFTRFIPGSYITTAYIVFVVPALISIMSIFYSKKVHEQFNSYFPVTLVE
ncbi:hypothetical protein Noda2021_08070 [Candidatus Dependentiae bacterium Noda2021]|nr:hypothetical protein Noda2021_08070 [Candidatus Dependentiae bacterium Noda2021]